MLKKVSLFGLAVAAILFSGCATKYSLVLPADEKLCKKAGIQNQKCFNNAKDTDFIVLGRGDVSLAATHTNINNATKAVLQIAAKSTLDAGKAYFAISHPSIISNVDGAMINTPQEFLEKCEISMLNIMYNKSPCNIMQNNRESLIMIRMYKERPNEFLTFDAQEVVDYLTSTENLQETDYVSIFPSEAIYDEKRRMYIHKGF